jgi:hypothetical protein
MPTVTVSDEYLDAAQGLIYTQWCKAFDNMKACKAEKPDLSEPDWYQMHDVRLVNGQKELDKWARLVEESKPISPLTRKG